MSARRFWPILAGLCAAGLALRLLYALALVGDDPLLGDAQQFHVFANEIADGEFFEQAGTDEPTADKPPLYPLLLSVSSLLGGTSWQAHQVVGCLVGTGTIAAIGLLGRRIAGPVVGLVAAALATVSPLLVGTDGSLRSESPYALLVALVLLAALALREAPTVRRAAVFGAVVGLAALTRGEAILFLPLLALIGWRPLVVAGVAALLVMTPWLARAWIAFDQPVAISTNTGGLIAGANCDRAYYGDLLGQWELSCLNRRRPGNEAEVANALRRDGLRYAREHADRLPVVLAARLGRTFELYRPKQNARLMRFFEGRNLRVAQATVPWLYALFALAVYGAVLLRRRGSRAAWVLVAPLLLVGFVTLTAYGWSRFRVAAEPGLIVLAAVALVELARRARGAARPAPPRPA